MSSLGASDRDHQLVSFDGEAGARPTTLVLLLAALLAFTLCAAVGLAPAAKAVTIDEFPIGATPTGITAGPDGNLWVTTTAPSILRVAPTGAVTARYPLKAFTDTTTTPSIPTFSDGALWFAIERTNTTTYATTTALGRRASDGAITEFPFDKVSSLAPGPNGSVWFPSTNGVGRVDPGGQTVTFGGMPSMPSSLAASATGGVWATAGSPYQVSAAGVATQTALAGWVWRVATSPSTPVVWFAGQEGLCCYTQIWFDFAIWFTPGAGGNRVPTAFRGAERVLDLAVGPDGNAWETDAMAPRIGRIAASGRNTVFTDGLAADATPKSIAAGPGDTVWFTDGAGRVGRITLERPSTTTEPAGDVGQVAAEIGAVVTPRGTASRVRFEYGTTTAYGTTTRWRDVGDGDAPVARNAQLQGLTPGTTYHYRAVVTSAFGTVSGPDRTLTTQPLPPPPPTPPADVDGDGYAAAVDCSDDSATIFPGAAEIPGDGIDQDCSGQDEALPQFFPHITAYFTTKARKWSRFTSLTIDDVPAGAEVQLRCSGPGCRFAEWHTRVRRDARALRLLPRLNGSKLGRTSVLKLRLTLTGHVGTVVRWKVGPPPVPAVTCLFPGSKKERRC